jgi:hypothetical protein
MAPATASKSSDEMKIVYFISAIPDWLKYSTAISILGLLTLVPLNLLRKKVSANLTFDNTEIRIQTNEETVSIPFQQIRRILINDLKDATGFPKGILQIAIQDRKEYLGRDKTTSFVLLDYGRGGQFLDELTRLPVPEIKYFDTTSMIYLDE